MTLRRTTLALAGALPLAGLLLAGPAGATIQLVSVRTTGLTPGTNYFADFTLTDGSGSGDGNSTAAISNFFFTNGALGPVLAPTTGNFTGGLGPTSTLTLKDGPGAATADYAQAFTVSSPASDFSFDLNLASTKPLDTPTPDKFTLQILDSTQTAIATTGPTGTEIVNADYGSKNPDAHGFHSTDSAIDPSVRATVSDVSAAPEPSEFAALGALALGLGGLALRARRRAA